MVDLMIILFHLKLDKFYCFRNMNYLKVICYDLLFFVIFVYIKMSYYWFNRQELLQKAKGKYHTCGGKEKVGEYYLANKDVIKEKANNKYKNLSEEEKEAKRNYERDRHKK